MGQAHAENGIPGVKQRHIHGGVGLGAGVGLYIGIIGVEQLFHPVDGQLLNHVDELTSTVIALARVTLGIFIGQDRALGLQDPRAGVILRGNEFDVLFLAQRLTLHGGP